MTVRVTPDLSPEVVQAMMGGLRDARLALHRSHGVTRCDMALVVPGFRTGHASGRAAVRSTGFLLSGECVCRDLIADMLPVVISFLTEHGATVENLPGAVRKHVSMRVFDVLRAYRAERGAQVKPKQVRGNRFGRALPDEEHRAVLSHLADEAGYSAPLPGQAYLMRRLAERCAAEFGNPVPYYLERMPAILRTVRTVCSRGARVNVGTRTSPEYVSWYDAYIDRPLGRRPEAAPRALSHDDTTAWGADQVPDPRADHEFAAVDRADGPAAEADMDAAVVHMVVTVVASAGPADQRTTLANAVRDLYGRGVLSRARAEALLADPGELDVLLARVRDVLDTDGRQRCG
jgi:hypothetical protein